MNKISMTSAAFGTILHLLQCEGRCLLPGNIHVDIFLAGREELCNNGWAELDFDGNLLPDRDFMRLVYGLSRCTAVLRLEQPGAIQWFVRTPIDLLFIEQRGETVNLEHRRGAAVLKWMHETVRSLEEGRLTACNAEGEEIRTDLAASAAESRARADHLAAHLCLFFGKERPHA